MDVGCISASICPALYFHALGLHLRRFMRRRQNEKIFGPHSERPQEKSRDDGTATARNILRILLLPTLALLVANLPASAEISQRDQKAIADAGTCESPQSALQSCGLIYIATVRKNHTQSTAAPVWFTTGADNNSFLIQTGKDTWKAKRIRRGSRVLIWIGKANGPAFIGTADITSDPAIQNKILTDFRQKYWRNRVLGTGPSRAAFQSGERVAIKITPVRDLPAGFTAGPGTPPPALHSGS
jgi:general stress protein 26